MRDNATKTDVPNTIVPKPGVITAISAQRKFRNRVNVNIDDSFAFGLHMDIVLAEGLSQGVALSEDKIATLLEADSFLKAREKAFRFIAYRPRSSEEIRQRLLRDQCSPEIIETVIERLTELDMLDDRKFTRDYISARMRNKGYGPIRIRQELKRKGIPLSLLDTELSKAFEHTTPEELAARTAEKMFMRLSRLDDTRIRKKKLSDYLSRRGYRFDQMEIAFERLESFVADMHT